MQILNRPQCKKCENPALTNIAGVWLCGECARKYLEKLREKQEKLILEE